MRPNTWLAVLAAIFIFAGTSRSQQSGQNQSQDQSAQASAPQQDPLAEAARRAKEQKKEESKAPKVFTNDNLPTDATISLVGTTTAPPPDKSTDTVPAKAPAVSEEQIWRDKFATLNHKLDQDQSELDVLQRELGVLRTQYYGGDPMKGLQQGLTQGDITAKTDKIDAKKKDVEADQQAISDAESDLQKAGGDPGWAR